MQTRHRRCAASMTTCGLRADAGEGSLALDLVYSGPVADPLSLVSAGSSIFLGRPVRIPFQRRPTGVGWS